MSRTVAEEPRPPFPARKLKKPGLEADLEPRPRYQATSYLPADKLHGRRALITGGDSGIGRAVAVLFAREGADVAIAYLPEEQADAEECKRAVEGHGRCCVLIPGDLTDPAFCAEAVDRTIQELGGIDLLVSNAAYQHHTSLAELTPEQFDRTFKTNVYAYYYLVRHAAPKMPPGSTIIATSSETGFDGSEALPDYSATKGAINQLTKVFAKQLIDRHIRVNAVAPGPVWTPLNPADDGLSADRVAKFGEGTPLGRPAQPEEIAPAYVFLASEPDSSFISGVILPIMGGETVGG